MGFASQVAVFVAGLCLCNALAPLMQDTPEDIPHDACGITSAINDDEMLELFALGYDGQVHHKRQIYNPTSVQWSNWIGLGGNFSSGVQSVRAADGRLEIFAVGQDDQLYHNWQQFPGGPYQDDWVPLGGPFSPSISVVLNSETNIAILARGKVSRSLMYNHQVRNSSAVYWAGWSSLGGILTSGPSAVITAEAMLHVFVRGVDKGLFEKKQVPTASGTVAWSKYEGLGGLLASHPSVPATLNPVNLLEIFVRQADRSIWFKRQLALTHEADSVTWSEWQTLGGKMSSGPSVVLNYDGLLEVYARGMNREIFIKHQFSHDSQAFYGWETLGGDSATTPHTVLGIDGSLHVFYLGTDKRMYHKTKTMTGKATYQWSEKWALLQNENTYDQFFRSFPC